MTAYRPVAHYVQKEKSGELKLSTRAAMPGSSLEDVDDRRRGYVSRANIDSALCLHAHTKQRV
jgi:hypothetical protein